MKQKVFFTLAFLAAVLFFAGKVIDSHTLRMITKPIPLLALLVLLKPDTRYRKFIFAGLLFSMVGDVLLEASPYWFLFGLLAFFTAHIAYVVAFAGRAHKVAWLPLIFLLMYGAGVYWLLYPGLQSMALPVLVYLLIILTMAWRAIAQTRFSRLALFATVGALFFVLSDSVLAFNKFYVTIPSADWIIMITYWTAQFLIFYSAYKSEKS